MNSFFKLQDCFELKWLALLSFDRLTFQKTRYYFLIPALKPAMILNRTLAIPLHTRIPFIKKPKP